MGMQIGLNFPGWLNIKYFDDKFKPWRCAKDFKKLGYLIIHASISKFCQGKFMLQPGYRKRSFSLLKRRFLRYLSR